MMRIGKKWATVLAAAALTVTVAAVAAPSTFAQDPVTPPPAPTTPEDAPPVPGRPFQHGVVVHSFGGPLGNMDELLAEELGITVEELNAARQRAQARAIDQAVQDGRLTQEQADELKARQALAAYLEPDALMADALGMTVEELQDARAAGKRLPEIIESQGLDMDDFRDALQQAHEDAVQRAVADGVITQEQADQFLDRNGLFRPHGFGGRWEFRGPQGELFIEGGLFPAPPIFVMPDSGA